MSDAATPTVRRSNATLAAFAASCLPYAALGLPVYVTLPEFYASHVGVPLAAVSLIFLIVRLTAPRPDGAGTGCGWRSGRRS